MAASDHANLVRKQFLVTEANVEKLDRIAAARQTSVTEVVRLAIDAFDAEDASTLNAPDLMDLVGTRLKEALRDTRKANKRVNEVLATLDKLENAV